MRRLPYTPSFSEIEQRLDRLLEEDRLRQQRNLERLARNIAAAESPGDGQTSGRSYETRATSGTTRDQEMEDWLQQGRDRMREAQVRASLPPVRKGSGDFGSSILDRVRANYDRLRGR